MSFSVAALVAATGGKLLSGDPLAPVEGGSLDSRSVRPRDAFFAIRGARTDGHRFVRAARTAGAAAAVVERGTPRALGVPASFPVIRVPSAALALQRTASARREGFRLPVVAVTGSNGKTAVKDLAASVLACELGETAVLSTRGNLNNHLGVPLMLLDIRAGHRIAVLELAMNHPGEIRKLARLASPTAGAILNAGRAHLGAFGSVEGVARAKAELLAVLPAGGWALLNADDPAVWARRSGTAARVAGFGIRRGDVRAERPSLDRDGRVRFRLCTPGESVRVRTRLAGRHGAANAAAAALIAWTHGVDARTIAHGLETFRPRARMRLERVRLKGGALAIVDCYNANPDSYAAAFAYLKGIGARSPLIVAGEMRELGRHGAAAHRSVGRAAAALNPGLLVGVGRLALPLVAGARAAGVRRVAWFRDALAAEDVVAGAIADAIKRRSLVLFKASRKVAMERLVDRLAAGKGAGYAV